MGKTVFDLVKGKHIFSEFLLNFSFKNIESIFIFANFRRTPQSKFAEALGQIKKQHIKVKYFVIEVL